MALGGSFQYKDSGRNIKRLNIGFKEQHFKKLRKINL